MSFYRNTVWLIKGLREYTKGGYERASKLFNASDLASVDCTGKHYIVTGSNSGLGKCIATAIAERGGSVHLVCRNIDSANEARDTIVRLTNNENVFVHQLDLSNTRDIFNFTEKFKQHPGQLDVLVNNAGCMVNSRESTVDGSLEKNFATNTLGTYCLTAELLPLLKSNSSGRVVTVSSGGMLVSKLCVEDLQSACTDPFDGTMVYAQNKRQQVVMTRCWSQLHPSVHFSSMHPGWADTPAVRTSMPDFYEKMKDRLRTAAQGADTAVWLAVSDAAGRAPSGLFFQDRVAVSDHLPLASTKTSPADDQQLMDSLEHLAKQYKQ